MLWSPLWELANRYGISVYRFVPLVVSTSQSFPNSWLITGLVTKVTRRVSLVEHDLLTIPEHPSSPRDFSGIHFAQFLVFCIALCRSLFVVGHCVVCPSSIYGFWFHFGIFKIFLRDSMSQTWIQVQPQIWNYRPNKRQKLFYLWTQDKMQKQSKEKVPLILKEPIPFFRDLFLFLAKYL